MVQRRNVAEDAQTRTRLQRTGTAWRRSRDAEQADRESRDAAIMDADEQGWGVRAIAGEVHLDPSTVQAVIVRETARRQRSGGE
jgi:DNA-binding NarL/FixJ family response regulator